jgi:hypothetical protein
LGQAVVTGSGWSPESPSSEPPASSSSLSSRAAPEAEAKAVLAGVECEAGERLDYHVHAHLDIIIEGQVTEISGNTGIRPECLFWLHTHSPNGILHVEAPEERDFTLGQFFAVWEQPLSATQILDRTTDNTHQIQATVNGEPWSGNPADIRLDDKTSIVIQYGPPFVPPPEFDWGQ